MKRSLGLATLVSVLARRLRRLWGSTGYRPEAHYMRGPGPKCRAAARHAAMGD